MNRREFLKAVAASVLLPVISEASEESSSIAQMQFRTLGNTGARVSLIGLGGYHVGRSAVSEEESQRIIRTAIDSGINFMDNCWDYNGGQSEIRMGRALLNGYRQKILLMTKLNARDAKNATAQLEEPLKRLRAIT